MIHLNGQKLTLQQIADVAYGREQVALAETHERALKKRGKWSSKSLLQVAPSTAVNTGFGKLSDVSIQSSELRELQLNLVR
jgi:histidine ammonia-lyase